jgi:hypothetical protein
LSIFGETLARHIASSVKAVSFWCLRWIAIARKMPRMRASLFALALAVFTVSPAVAVEPLIFKLHPFDPEGAGTTGFGLGMAVNEKYILVGDYRDDTLGEDAGAVYVFSAKTRKLLTVLTAEDAGAFDSFGYSVALWGDIAVVGAPFDNVDTVTDAGSVYLFDLKKGTELRKLTASDGLAFDELGTSVATNGELVVAGAPFRDNGLDADTGSAVVFRISDGAQVQRLTATTPVALGQLGYSVAMSGDLALLGAPFAEVGGNTGQGQAILFDAAEGAQMAVFEAPDGEVNDTFGYAVAVHGRSVVVGAGSADIDTEVDQGAVYLFDLYSGGLVRKLVAPDGGGGEFFGDALAMNGNQILIGAPFQTNGVASGNGAAYLVDTITGGVWQKLGAIDGKQDDNLGFVVAMDASTVVIGAIGDDTYGVDSGAAYGFAALAQPLPTLDLVKRGDFAPGLPDTVLSSFTSLQMNEDKEVQILGAMTGTGTRGGRTRALWSGLGESLAPDMVLADELLIDTRVAAITNPVLEHPDGASWFARISGSGVTASNDTALVFGDGGSSSVRLAESDALGTAPFSGQTVKQLVQMAGSAEKLQAAVAVKLNGAAAADSAVVLQGLDVDTIEGGALEGASSPVGGVNFGQLSTRVAMGGSLVASSAALQDVPATNALLYTMQDNGPNSLIARKGDPVTTGGTLRSFLGETVSADGDALFRASIAGVPSSRGEGLFVLRSMTAELLAQKGTPAPGVGADVRFSRILRFAMLKGGQALFLVQLSGKGVNASNDLAVYLDRQISGPELLMREGQLADDCLGAKIGVIQRIDADPVSGSYLVVTTLAGAASSSNLAVWMGETPTILLVDGEEYLVPRLRMRKGNYQALGGNTSLMTSVKLLVPVDSTGAVAKGMGKAVADGWAALQMTFANKQVILGRLPPPL